MKNYCMPLLLLGIWSCNTSNMKSSDSVANGNRFDASAIKAEVVTTDSAGLRMHAMDSRNFSPLAQPVEGEVYVFVDPDKTFQTYMGIGAALTDASAETFYKLPKAQQAEFLKAHFDTASGLGYTIARTNINSCDFSSGSYTYVQDGDKELKTLILGMISSIKFHL
jgi:glucosylceramidase